MESIQHILKKKTENKTIITNSCFFFKIGYRNFHAFIIRQKLPHLKYDMFCLTITAWDIGWEEFSKFIKF